MEEHDEAAEKLEREADHMEELGDELKENIEETREDWEAKQRSESVPGAQETGEDG
jgi:hypothetical protein